MQTFQKYRKCSKPIIALKSSQSGKLGKLSGYGWAMGYIGALLALPMLVGGKVYNMMQAVFTAKVVIVLGFCLIVGVFFVSAENWGKVFGGFFKFGTMPVQDAEGNETVTNVFAHRWEHGVWPVLAMGNIALLGAFAGYAGGGGLGNALYSNFVRDKGWGMGSAVGAIPSAIGGRKITLSHIGKSFPVNDENLKRWEGWWKYIRTDQLLIWLPGCLMGMALPALISMQFSPHSPMFENPDQLKWAQGVISADGMRNAPGFSPALAQFFWVATCLVGLVVLLPSQMSIIEDVCRRWTDILWSGSKKIREEMKPDQVKRIYYTILGLYIFWTFFVLTLFQIFGNPKTMVLLIANLNTIGIGFTSFLILRMNCRLLPPQLRPRWYHRVGMIACGVFYLGMATIVFINTQVPLIKELFFEK